MGNDPGISAERVREAAEAPSGPLRYVSVQRGLFGRVERVVAHGDGCSIELPASSLRFDLNAVDLGKCSIVLHGNRVKFDGDYDV